MRENPEVYGRLSRSGPSICKPECSNVNKRARKDVKVSDSNPSDLPLWAQGRKAVLDASEGVTWREEGPPDYTRQERSHAATSQHNHPEGSLESIVQNLVKVFEMEVSFKSDPKQWLSVVADKFQIRTNGKAAYNAADVAREGTYNLFIEPTEHYDNRVETFESSSELFLTAFPDGFLWEVTEVISGPPRVIFKWRHWGAFKGPFRNFDPTGETVEVSGVTIADVTDDLKITSMEHYFDNSAFLGEMTKGCPMHGGPGHASSPHDAE